jgi:hypothetical protein
MKERIKRFVIKDDPTWEGPTPFAKCGWRIGGPGSRDDGSDDPLQDVMWGLGRADDESIATLIASVREKYGEIEIIDLRGKESTVEELD